ncbi:MerR family transcriptional regulator [Mycobacterium intermedium]
MAIYDHNHLWQLQIIMQLLGKGYTIAHIQDFFEGFAKNLDLADTLGVQELAEKTGMRKAFTAPWTGTQGTQGTQRAAGPGSAQPLRLDPLSELARNLVGFGLAQRDGDEVMLADGDIAAVVADAKDPSFYLRMLLEIAEATGDAVQKLAETTIEVLRNHLVDHYGEGWIPPTDQQRDLADVITDARELAGLAVHKALNAALAENAIRAIGEYFEGMMTTPAPRSDE